MGTHIVLFSLALVIFLFLKPTATDKPGAQKLCGDALAEAYSEVCYAKKRDLYGTVIYIIPKQRLGC